MSTFPWNCPNVTKLSKNIPYSPIHNNAPKLKQYLLNQFSDTNFIPGVSFPKMNALAAQIHLKPNTEPYEPNQTYPNTSTISLERVCY